MGVKFVHYAKDGSGASFETCTMTTAGTNCGVAYFTAYINGEMSAAASYFYEGVVLDNVLCGSMVIFFCDLPLLGNETITDGFIVARNGRLIGCNAPTEGGVSATVTIYAD